MYPHGWPLWSLPWHNQCLRVWAGAMRDGGAEPWCSSNKAVACASLCLSPADGLPAATRRRVRAKARFGRSLWCAALSGCPLCGVVAAKSQLWTAERNAVRFAEGITHQCTRCCLSRKLICMHLRACMHVYACICMHMHADADADALSPADLCVPTKAPQEPSLLYKEKSENTCKDTPVHIDWKPRESPIMLHACIHAPMMVPHFNLVASQDHYRLSCLGCLAGELRKRVIGILLRKGPTPLGRAGWAGPFWPQLECQCKNQ